MLFDEFHERSLDGDFGLALALDVQGALRPDLRLLVMSATLDGARVARLLDDAPVIESAGPQLSGRYPLRGAPGRHADRGRHGEGDPRGAGRRRPAACSPSCPASARSSAPPNGCEGRLPPTCDVVPLYGMLDGKAQDAAIRPAPPGRRKVVLATSIAETSITIDGVRVVIDSGLSRLPRYEPATRADAAGDGARLAAPPPTSAPAAPDAREPGVAIRLWRAEQTAALPAFTPPEILRGRPFRPAARLRRLRRRRSGEPALPRPAAGPGTRRGAGAAPRRSARIDAAGRLTRAGEAMRKLALPVRLAHMVAEAAQDGPGGEAAELAVLLTERGLGGDSADLERRLIAFPRRSARPRAQCGAAAGGAAGETG